MVSSTVSSMSIYVCTMKYSMEQDLAWYSKIALHQ